MSDSLKLY